MKLSLQSANLNNGVEIFISTSQEEFKKLNISKHNLFTNKRGLGAIYYATPFTNVNIGYTTVEPPDEGKALLSKIPNIVSNHIFNCLDLALDIHDTNLKRRLNRLDIEWEVEKEFDESEDLIRFLNETQNNPHFVLRRASTAKDKFIDKYGINIKTTHFDADGKMAIDYYDFNNRYVVSYDIFGITNDGRFQLYYVRWYDKPSLQYVEDNFDNDPNMIRIGAIEFVIGNRIMSMVNNNE